MKLADDRMSDSYCGVTSVHQAGFAYTHAIPRTTNVAASQLQQTSHGMQRLLVK